MCFKSAIFIDGPYFDRVLRDWGSPRIDFDLLASDLAYPDTFFRTYYYHCLPYLSPVPTPEEEERLEGKRRFFSALDRLERFEVREGKLEFRGTDRETNRPILEQKRLSAYLTADLVQLAVKKSIDRAVLVTGDSDFLPAMRIAQTEGILVHLYHGTESQKPSRALWETADERTEFTADLLQITTLNEETSEEDRGPRVFGGLI